MPAFDLAAEREKRGMTQHDVADLLCTSQPSVNRWEQTGQMPALERKYWALYWKHHPKRKKK